MHPLPYPTKGHKSKKISQNGSFEFICKSKIAQYAFLKHSYEQEII